jgi:chemotaxis protein MotB
MAQIRRSLTVDERRAKATAWALTFADMVTLLLTFFVLLLVILNDADEHIDRIVNQLLDETYEELKANVASSQVSVDRVTKGIKITMRGKLFKSMSADVDPRVYPLLVQIGAIIRTSKIIGVYDNPDYVHLLDVIDKRNTYLNVEVRCEGHTDDLELPNAAEYPSNWELSSARSLNFVRVLSTYAEMPQRLFSAMGYGKFRPIIDVSQLKSKEQINEARAQNRRVEIYLDAFLRNKTEFNI